jgi:hypothetical protein
MSSVAGLLVHPHSITFPFDVLRLAPFQLHLSHNFSF